jgi:hypothetical protein
VENTNLYKSTHPEKIRSASTRRPASKARILAGRALAPLPAPTPQKNKNKYYLARVGSIWLLIFKLKPCWIKQKSLQKSR